MSHAFYIAAAYAVTALVLGGLIASSLIAARRAACLEGEGNE
jgi:heme exporter protein CcmD